MTSSNNLNDIQLDSCEDCGKCGAFLGCLTGCISYWFCCIGLYKLWWNVCCLSETAKNDQDLNLDLSLVSMNGNAGSGGGSAGGANGSAKDAHAHSLDQRTTCHYVCCIV